MEANTFYLVLIIAGAVSIYFLFETLIAAMKLLKTLLSALILIIVVVVFFRAAGLILLNSSLSEWEEPIEQNLEQRSTMESDILVLVPERRQKGRKPLRTVEINGKKVCTSFEIRYR